jgi:hypothetical protein
LAGELPLGPVFRPEMFQDVLGQDAALHSDFVPRVSFRLSVRLLGGSSPSRRLTFTVLLSALLLLSPALELSRLGGYVHVTISANYRFHVAISWLAPKGRVSLFRRRDQD